MLYQLFLLVHLVVVGFAFFVSGALFMLHARIEKAEDIRDARSALAQTASLSPLMPVFAALLLLTGLMLTRLNWSFTSPWVLLAIIGLVVMTVNGIVILKPRNAVLLDAATHASELTPELMDGLRDPVIGRAEVVNIALSVGIIALMVIKPPLLVCIAILLLLPLVAFVRVPSAAGNRARA